MKMRYRIFFAVAIIVWSTGVLSGASNAAWANGSSVKYVEPPVVDRATARDGKISKAIIVAGAGPYSGNTLWSATQMLANFAFQVLAARGYGKDAIYYLSADANVDIDENGVFDEVDADAANNHFRYAITAWAADADDLFIYMTGHGGCHRLGQLI